MLLLASSHVRVLLCTRNFNGGGGHIASPLSIRTSRPVRRKNGFPAITFEYIGVLDSYFIHMYIIIKYRSSLITEKIHQLL